MASCICRCLGQAENALGHILHFKAREPCGLMGWVSSGAPKRCLWTGHRPELQVRSPGGGPWEAADRYIPLSLKKIKSMSPSLFSCKRGLPLPREHWAETEGRYGSCSEHPPPCVFHRSLLCFILTPAPQNGSSCYFLQVSPLRLREVKYCAHRHAAANIRAASQARDCWTRDSVLWIASTPLWVPSLPESA